MNAILGNMSASRGFGLYFQFPFFVQILICVDYQLFILILDANVESLASIELFNMA